MISRRELPGTAPNTERSVSERVRTLEAKQREAGWFLLPGSSTGATVLERLSEYHCETATQIAAPSKDSSRPMLTVKFESTDPVLHGGAPTGGDGTAKFTW